MSRFADALKQAGADPAQSPDADGAENGDSVRFFAAGQPAVVAPWDLGPGTGGRAKGHDQLRRGSADVQASPAVAEHTRQAVHPLSNQSNEKLVVSPGASGIAREQYNKLAAALHQSQLEREIRVVMVTSAVPGEGKTFTAANLALTFSEQYRHEVLLIDADLRRPTVHTVLGIANERGLSDLLGADGPPPLIRMSSCLSVLPAGVSGGNPMKTLTSQGVRAFVNEARSTYNWVIIDTAPVGLLTDAKLLASIADATLLVVLAGKTPYNIVQSAAAALGSDRIFGVVLNRVAEAALPLPYDQNYYGAYCR